MLAIAAAAAVLSSVAACGGTTTKTTTATSLVTTTTAIPATTTSTTTSGGSTTTPAGRTPVTTSVKGSPADVEIGKDLVPEATATYTFKPAALNGTQYTNALVISASSSPEKIEINAGRSHAKFVGVLGVPDNGKSSSSFQVDVSLDGAAPAFSAVIGFGETKDINLDIPNVLRIKITVVSKDTSYDSTVAIGNPHFA